MYRQCEGWIQRVHEVLQEKHGLAVKYSTLTRKLPRLGIGQESEPRWARVPDEPGTEMQHDTTLYSIQLGDQRIPLIASLLYLRYSKRRYLQYYLGFDLLLIDEIGYFEVEPVQVGLFFTLMQGRHQKNPTLLTSNLGFSEWQSFLKNEALTAALMDRLTENSHIINMKQCVSLPAKLSSED